MTAAAVTPDRSLVATSSDAGRLIVRDAGGRQVAAWQVGGSPNELAIDPVGRQVAAALNEGPIVLARLGDPAVRTIGRDSSAAITVAFSSDGAQLAAGGRDGRVRVWRDGGRPRTLGAMDGPVFSLAFSPDDRHLAASGADKTVRVYAVSGSGPPQVLRGHADAVPSVAFTADGARLVSGGLDGLRVWDWRRDVTLLSLDAAQGAIQVSPFGSDPRIVHYGFDHVPAVTDCDVCGSVASVEALMSRRTTRGLTPQERSDFRVSGS